MAAEGWAKIKQAAKYGGVGERTLRGVWLKTGLKHVRLDSGMILIKFSWIDEFLEGFVAKEDAVDKIVRETLKKI